jgi:quercetin dioxygenase-like cupin family protein
MEENPDPVGKNMTDRALSAGITPAGAGKDEVAWNVLGHRYFLKTLSEGCFCFETYDPPGTLVPLHLHPKQDEFIYLLEGSFDLQLGDAEAQARPGDLVRMPRGIPHSYANNARAPARALFWVTPAGRLKELFDALHDLTDIEEAMRRSALHDVQFIR